MKLIPTNARLCNGAVVLADFGDAETDAFATQTLQQAYPSRKIITLNLDVLGELGGGIHCATQQQPLVRV